MPASTTSCVYTSWPRIAHTQVELPAFDRPTEDALVRRGDVDPAARIELDRATVRALRRCARLRAARATPRSSARGCRRRPWPRPRAAARRAILRRGGAPPDARRTGSSRCRRRPRRRARRAAGPSSSRSPRRSSRPRRRPAAAIAASVVPDQPVLAEQLDRGGEDLLAGLRRLPGAAGGVVGAGFRGHGLHRYTLVWFNTVSSSEYWIDPTRRRARWSRTPCPPARSRSPPTPG